eukprot:augustus_masked-scaffold_15-processed-gene-10.53-mRNA-1 protein AED:0.02 eAED:0.03 QI:0/-1/0/1/-1/1/1/0/1410
MFPLLLFIGKLGFFFCYVCLNRDVELIIKSSEINEDELAERLLDEEDFDVEGQQQPERTPEGKASLFSKLTFFWMQPLMRKGYSKPLEEHDFYKTLEEDEAIKLSERFQDELRKISDGKLSQKSLLLCLHRAGVFSPFYEAFFFKIIYDTLNFVPPQILNRIITFISDESQDSIIPGVYLTAALFVSNLTQTLLLHQYFHRVYRTGMRVRTSLVTSIYQKGLRLANSKEQKTNGEIVNLMSTDCTRLQGLFTYLHILWSACYVICLSLFFLWEQIRYAVFIPILVICGFSIPVTNLVTKKIKKVQKEVMKVKDARLKLTTETIGNMKTVKMYGWQKSFTTQLEDVRTEELGKLKTYYKWRMGSRLLWNGTPILVTLSAFVGYFTLNSDSDFSAARAFTSVSLLNLLRFPLAVLPNIVNNLAEASVSLTRIAEFLSSPEINGYSVKGTEKKVVVKVEKGRFFWETEKLNVAVSFPQPEKRLLLEEGQIYMVTGKVGSGKTALLKLLVNDLVPEGNETIENSAACICYAAQVPFIQNETLKQNIIFHHPFDKVLYEKVVKACALRPDFKTLPMGDGTEIGEKGINLSGGQKARVSLARAVYASNFGGEKDGPVLLLLESVFEAVDEHVGDHIWKNVFCGMLKEPNLQGKMRTVVCVTHALKRLKDENVDKILLMKNGEVSIQGSYQELYDLGNEDFEELVEALRKTRETAEGAKNAESKDASTELLSSDEHKAERAVVSRRDSLGSTASQASSVKPTEVGKDLTGKEERAVGEVSKEVYLSYLSAAGGFLALFFIFISYLLQTAMDFLSTRWLAYWSSREPKPDLFLAEQGFSTLAIGSGFNQEMTHNFHSSGAAYAPLQGVKEVKEQGFYLGVFAFLSGLYLFAMLLTVISVLTSGFRASRVTYRELLDKVMHAKMSFFDTTPTGRILNRFSKDIYTVDEVLPYTISSFLGTSFSVLGTVFSISYVAPWFLVMLPFLSVFYRYIQKYYIASSRELQRWDSVLRSPIYSFFTETLEGRSSVRAYGLGDTFKNRNLTQLDKNLRAYYLSVSANRWLAVRLECIGTSLSVGAAFLVVIQKGRLLEAGLAGLALSYSMQITQSLNWTVRMVSDLETNMVSVERLSEYKMNIETEAEVPATKKTYLENWPSKGVIEFEKLEARYREKLPLVLRGINLKIEAGEKVGIVGRTAAGKSSLFVLLMRLVEPSGGRIVIDGVDLSTLDLHTLRQRIAVIPQDPVMFSGSLRLNLDPTKSFADDAMMKALKTCQLLEQLENMLKSTVSPSNGSTSDEEVDPIENVLDMYIQEGGSNFSFGQRQLICIARAVLRDCKILLLDEATSGIDLATDRAIQEAINTEFKNSTVLTVAHRIETILGGDKVLVMDAGKVAEYGEPKQLLEDPNSKFSGLVNKMRYEKH